MLVFYMIAVKNRLIFGNFQINKLFTNRMLPENWNNSVFKYFTDQKIQQDLATTLLPGIGISDDAGESGTLSLEIRGASIRHWYFPGIINLLSGNWNVVEFIFVDLPFIFILVLLFITK